MKLEKRSVFTVGSVNRASEIRRRLRQILNILESAPDSLLCHTRTLSFHINTPLTKLWQYSSTIAEVNEPCAVLSVTHIDRNFSSAVYSFTCRTISQVKRWRDIQVTVKIFRFNLGLLPHRHLQVDVCRDPISSDWKFYRSLRLSRLMFEWKIRVASVGGIFNAAHRSLESATGEEKFHRISYREAGRRHKLQEVRTGQFLLRVRVNGFPRSTNANCAQFWWIRSFPIKINGATGWRAAKENFPILAIFRRALTVSRIRWPAEKNFHRISQWKQ